MAMSKRYQNLKMLQRAGVHMKVGGFGDVEQGELAVKCPACPHPGINMDVVTNGPFKEYVFVQYVSQLQLTVIYRLKNTQFVMLDANFHLTQKNKGIMDDPDLAPGLAYFVDDAPYKAHLKAYIEELEVSIQ